MKNMSGIIALARLLAISVVTSLVLMGTAVGEVSRTWPGVRKRMWGAVAGVSIFQGEFIDNH